jgi:hypothetical protein
MNLTIDQTLNAVKNLNKQGFEASYWEMGQLRRIYINGVGFNNRKKGSSQKLWIDCTTCEMAAKTVCNNVDQAWIDSQNAQLVSHYQKLARYVRIISRCA